MDLVALAITLLGLGAVAAGYVWIGAFLTLAPLLALAVALGRGQRPSLLLPFTFRSWFIVLPVAILAVMVLHFHGLVQADMVPLGLALYYAGAISLVEQRARYVPWGAGTGWRTATRADRPVVYWLVVALNFCLAGVFLALALAFLTRAGAVQS